MLRLTGMVCILCGSTGLGLAFARDLDLRIEELNQLRQLMLLLRGEIRYMHQPLPEAFLHLAADSFGCFGEFFRQTGQDLIRRDGQTSEEIWKRNLKQYVPGLHMTGQEQRELEKLGSMLGYLDVEMQLNALDYYLEQLKVSLEQAAEAVGSRRKLYQYLGVLGGMALVILIF
ncbi:MAG: stage III sporulation protein AB [Clostridiales bacterium]|nr:stage III sporulation protein AB [Clostridiales bacterium]